MKGNIKLSYILKIMVHYINYLCFIKQQRQQMLVTNGSNNVFHLLNIFLCVFVIVWLSIKILVTTAMSFNLAAPTFSTVP